MARPQTIPDDALLDRLEAVFARAGYHGASLSALAEAAGLQKASLYHRFPGGKAQMASDVLAAARARLDAQVLAPLTSEGPVRKRLTEAAAALDLYFDGGRRASLLNILAAPGAADGELAAGIEASMMAILAAFEQVARDAGSKRKKARAKAERAVIMLEGALVLSRALNDPGPFRSVLERLPEELG